MGWSQVSPIPASYWPDADTCGSGLSPHREVSVQCGTHATKTPLVSPFLRTGFASSEATVKTHSIYTSWIYPYLPVHISGLIICPRYITLILLYYLKRIFSIQWWGTKPLLTGPGSDFSNCSDPDRTFPIVRIRIQFYRSKDLGITIPQF